MTVASLPADVAYRATPTWPEPLQEAALHGLAGDFVRLVLPHTEADPAALLTQYLLYAGAVIGRGPHFRAEADRHGVNEFLVLVGETAKARKGTSRGRVHAVYERVDEEWARDKTPTGLVSGEGLIFHVRDPISKIKHSQEGGMIVDSQMVVTDPGIEDKRLLVYEPEFASVLRTIGREGNTLSPVLRNAWDSGTLRTLAKNSPVTATGRTSRSSVTSRERKCCGT